VILLCGIPSETALVLVREQLERLAARVIVFNQREFDACELEYEIAGGNLSGTLRLDARRFALEDFDGVYTRVMDEQRLPELRGEPERSPARQRARRFHRALAEWIEIAPARVVNRARPQGSNASKPYQAQLIRAQGFAIPETLVTNDPELVREFVTQHGRVVYKSASGMRSIVQLVGPDDLERLDRIRWCPVQFQAYVEGTDVRAHVVADEVFATAVRSSAVDYRYALRQRLDAAELEAVELSDELAERCVALAAALELPFAGIDLRLSATGEATCFEVNPSPAYSYYELGTGQPIARALARHLLGG
jgi:glutathione synthase/RimK-type ligase-like ATP-grasp enzyme